MMKTARRWILVLALALILQLTLAACGGNSGGGQAGEATPNTQGEAAPAEAAGEGYLIGFSNFSVANTWRVQFEEEFRYRADSLKADGVISDYIMTNSQNDTTKQISDIQDLITKGCDAIIVTAGNPDAVAPVCEEAVEKGIVVVAVDQVVNSDLMDARISFRNYDYGVSIANFMMDNLESGSKILVLEGIAGTAGSEEQIKGFNDTIAGGNLEILASVPCDWDYATAKKAMEGLITAHAQIDGVASMGGQMTQAALEVLSAAGRPINIPMSGEANNGFLKAWKKYLPEGYIGNAPSCQTSQGAMGLELAIEILGGDRPAQKDIYIDIPVITEDTLDDYLREDWSDGYWPPCILPEEELVRLYQE